METVWGATSLSNKPEEYSSSTEREARSVALEKAYVHDVYSQIASHFSDSRYRAWPKVKQFLLDLEPGSVVCDVGCGNGKYLDINPTIYKIGVDRCSSLTNAAKEKNHEVLISDNLTIPFRDDCFDAVISIAVIHHFATIERRVAALKELARVLRIGGKLMVSVWAMEQRHRKFESQDVLVPWNRPMHWSSDDKTSSIERDLNSTTTTTSDDDAATHYNAYTQTSDSDHSFPAFSLGGRKRGRARHRGRSIDPTCPSSSQSSSDLSSPNESCYTFVRKALQKLAGSRRSRRRPWFLQGLDIPVDEDGDHFGSLEEEDALNGLDIRSHLTDQQINNFMPIELRQLESSDFEDLFSAKSKTESGMMLANVLNPTRRRTLDTASDILHPSGSIAAQPKSKSLSDLLSLIPVRILRWTSTEEFKSRKTTRSTSSLFGIYDEEIQFPDFMKHKAIQTDEEEEEESCESLDQSGSNVTTRPASEILGNILNPHQPAILPTNYSGSGSSSNLTVTVQEEEEAFDDGKKQVTNRPTLVKQKQSICSPSASSSEGHGGTSTSNGQNESTIPVDLSSSQPPICWGEMKKSVRDLPDLKPMSNNTLQVPKGPFASFWKQSSLNDELIYSERLKEKELLKQNIQKQCSLNEELIYKQRESTRWDQMKEAFLNSPNVKSLMDGISNRLRATYSGSTIDNAQQGQHNHQIGHDGDNVSPVHSTNGDDEAQNTSQQQPSYPYLGASSSIRNGLVRMLQNWKGEQTEVRINNTSGSYGVINRRGSKEGTQRRGLFPHFFLRRSSAGSLSSDPMSSKVISPPHMKTRPSENELQYDCLTNGNKLLPGVRHGRKLSREEGSDSSKDSSFQSDTSVDSEDSFASVIFIPNKGSMDPDVFTFNADTRANSIDSDRSPKSPVPRLSPPYYIPKSPSPLASELLGRRRSPESSPSKIGLLSASETTRFVFDEQVTSLLTGPTLEATSEEDQFAVSVPVPQAQLAGPVSVDKPDVTDEKKEQDVVITPPQQHPVPSEKTGSMEKIEVLRKPAVLPEGDKVSSKLVRRSLPKALAAELFNPETDDADTSDTSSSSPNSVSSVISVVNEEVELLASLNDNPTASVVDQPNQPIPKRTDSPVPLEPLSSIQEEEPHPSLPLPIKTENEPNNTSSKATRKLTLAKLCTSEWLSSIPCEAPTLVKRSSLERRHGGEKMLLGDVKKYQQKGPDAKWPSTMTDDSPSTSDPIDMNTKLLEEAEEADSLFDSLENLSTTRQHPSRNPSLDSSVRMSSTTSCSIRGGESFESWSSAKSANSSHKASLPSLLPQHSLTSKTMLPRMIRHQGTSSSKSSSACGEDEPPSTALTYHRYYHVFREGELDKLIEKYVQNLHIISSYYDHANWCIIAEKVQVWTI